MEDITRWREDFIFNGALRLDKCKTAKIEQCFFLTIAL